MPTTAKPTAAEMERENTVAYQTGYNHACDEAAALLTRLTGKCKAQIAILEDAAERIVDQNMDESEDD